MTVIILLPLVALLAQSVLDGQGRFVGASHFIAYFSTGRWSALWNSVALSAVSAVVCVALAYGYAWALTHTALPAKGLWRALALLPTARAVAAGGPSGWSTPSATRAR